MTDDEYTDVVLRRRWYVVVNDVVGGWTVSTVDKPVSAHLTTGIARDALVGDVLTEELARHIVRLHDTFLDGADEA